MKILHSADLHFSNNEEKLDEVIATTDFLLDFASHNVPDCIVIAGDSVDEYDSRIRMDSRCARAAISFFERAADIAPVVVVIGTRSHDRESPYLFRHLRSKFPVYVASDVDMVSLDYDERGDLHFTQCMDGYGHPLCAFTLVPSLDKAALLGRIGGDSIKDGNFQFREAVHDMFAGFGLINSQMPCPTVLVTHGMATGAVFSTGQCAVGEDLEFSLNDLQAAKCDAVMLGHVHKYQSWGNVAYSGSPGRLNFGEQEEKGFLLWTFDDGSASHQFIPTPARRFVFGDLPEWSGAENVYNEAVCMARDCQGAYVRLRYVVPEEERQSVDRGHLEAIFGGAASVKIEVQVIPKVRSRAAGISRVDSLPEKVQRWGTTVDIEIPDNVLALAANIEGKDAEELLADAMDAVSGVVPVAIPAPVDDYQDDLFSVAV